MDYTVLSPWAEVDKEPAVSLTERLDSLNGKTIGIFSHFKGHSPIIGKIIEDEIRANISDVEFSYFQYKKDTHEIELDEEVFPDFENWLKGVDGVIAVYGDAGSCTMYHAMNTSQVEKHGIPAVMLVNENLITSGLSGCSGKGVPELRFVKCTLDMPSSIPVLDEDFIENTIKPAVVPCVKSLMDGLTAELTEKEKTIPEDESNKLANETFTGNIFEINNMLYKRGLGNGLPIMPATREAVDEMLKGTDLPPDHVVAVLPPLKGKATVEKIAINAVMAGCLPTYMPILIAMVECMADPEIHLTGWTCSTAGFAPVIVLSGSIRKAIGAQSVVSSLSPLFKPNACIARAYALITQNISGVRPTMEITGGQGHENLLSIVISEDQEDSPWTPVHADYGIREDESAVMMFWIHSRTVCRVGTKDPGSLLATMCDCTDDQGFDPGATFVVNSTWARALAAEGMTRNDVRDYICEYARKSAADVRVRWMKDNNHMPRSLQLPLDPTRSCRKYYDTKHLQVIVSGSHDKMRCIAYSGGGDHGGPAVSALRLPKAWDELVEKYACIRPEFIKY